MRKKADWDSWILGSALRHARHQFWNLKEVQYDPKRAASLNDLVLGEFVPPDPPLQAAAVNWVERVCPGGSDTEFELISEPFRQEMLIGVVGNRYAPPYLIGGLNDPISGKLNGEIKGGVTAQSLFGANCIGFINSAQEDFPRVPVRIQGVLVDGEGRPLNLRDFREILPAEPLIESQETRCIVVTGFATDAGKTLCARALIRELKTRGFRVTAEKKSGTACCRDWISYWSDDYLVDSTVLPARFSLTPPSHPGRDFVDAMGIASDSSLDRNSFVKESVDFTERLLRLWAPDFHIMELADNLAHRWNWALLAERRFADRLSAIIYCPQPTVESGIQAASFVRALMAPAEIPLLYSGPLANERRYEMARQETQERLEVPVKACARREGARWVAEGGRLTDALLELLEVRHRPHSRIRSGDATDVLLADEQDPGSGGKC